MKKKALITGVSGFVGQHLQRELLENGYEVVGVDREKMNVCDYDVVHAIIRKYKPDYIFHLAGIAYVPTSWKDPEMTYKVNTLGTLHLLDAVRSVGIDPKIHLCGSSEEYGMVYEDELPIKETNPLRPLSPYAVSKIGLDMLGYQYYKSYGLKIIRTRAFNHDGYGRGEEYMTSNFAKQIIQIEKGYREPIIYHGELSSKRDISDVRDIVVAYRLALEKCDFGEVYNIGLGVTHTVGEVLQMLIDLSHVKVELKLDSNRMRPSDVKVLLCDGSKFIEKTGWKPKYSLEDVLSEELRFWREKL
jgi:GDP-4-dehydro-6-deoxy-D-mannose reductase